MDDQPTPPEEFRQEVRNRLVRLLATEVTAAWDAAVTAGGEPDQLGRIIDERRRAIERASAAAEEEMR